MSHAYHKHYYLLITLSLLATQQCWAQTPAPASNTQFPLPLADKTTATAVLLPTHDGQAVLVYATTSGKIAFYYLTGSQPSPQPNPTPPDPTPVPPTPAKLTIAIVEDPKTTTPEQRQVLANKTWRKLATEKHTFQGIIPTDVTEKGTSKPPASLVPFLNRAAGKNLPWLMLVLPDRTIVWEGQLPATAAELTALIHKHGD